MKGGWHPCERARHPYERERHPYVKGQGMPVKGQGIPVKKTYIILNTPSSMLIVSLLCSGLRDYCKEGRQNNGGTNGKSASKRVKGPRRSVSLATNARIKGYRKIDLHFQVRCSNCFS